MSSRRRTYSFSVGPSSVLFRSLLEFGLGHCSSALVVVRSTNEMGENAKQFIESLSPILLAKEVRSEWPGTILHGEKATVYRFTFNRTAVELILRFSQGLYEWQHPELPEDLCLLRKEGEAWLLSIAHEYDAALILDEKEFQQLRNSAPDLARLLTPDDINGPEAGSDKP